MKSQLICQKCSSDKILDVSAKCSDLCSFSYLGEEGEYAPSGVNLGNDGDYLEFKLCLNCGQHQGKFPSFSTLERELEGRKKEREEEEKEWQKGEERINWVSNPTPITPTAEEWALKTKFTKKLPMREVEGVYPIPK